MPLCRDPPAQERDKDTLTRRLNEPQACPYKAKTHGTKEQNRAMQRARMNDHCELKTRARARMNDPRKTESGTELEDQNREAVREQRERKVAVIEKQPSC